MTSIRPDHIDNAKPGKDDKKRPRPPKAVLDQARERADSVKGAMDAWQARHGKGQYVSTTPHGTVAIGSLRTGKTEDGITYVDVFLSGHSAAGDPHYRIINPPSMVTDPSGPVERGKQRYRVDPLAAIAEAIAQHGGTRPEGGRR